MKSTTQKKKKTFLKWLKRLGITIAFLFLVPFTLFTIGWFSRDLIIEQLQIWYESTNSGTLEIGKVDATFLSGFPNVGFTINDIHQTSVDTLLDKHVNIIIDRTEVTIGASDLLSADLQFKSIKIYDAEIVTEVITEKTPEQYIQLKKDKQANHSDGLELPSWLHSEKSEFYLKNVSFISKDTMLNKFFDLRVNSASGRMKSEKNGYSGNLSFQILVNDLGFNMLKGSYINEAIVSGKPTFTLDQKNNSLEIPDFILNIGEEDFKVSAQFDFEKSTGYKIALENTETNFQSLKNFLPGSLSKKLSRYTIIEPMVTQLELEGKFHYGDVPFVNGKFSTLGNRVLLDSIQIDRVSFDGHLTNELNRSKTERNMPGRKDIRVFFEDFTGEIDDIEIVARESYFQTTDTAKNFINANLQIYGSNETLARVLKAENFNFKGGNFAFDARINGDISNVNESLNSASGNFRLNNTRVILRKNELQLPVETVSLNLQKDISNLNELKINLPNGESLVFSGTVANVSALLSSDPEKPAHTSVILDSDNLNINDLIATAVEFIPETEKKSKKLQTLHETLQAIYHKFHPRFQLNLDTLTFNELDFNDLKASVLLKDPETIQFDSLSFNYQNAFTGLNGTLRVPDPGNASIEPIYLDVNTKSSGALSIFQNLFEIELMNIVGGNYNFSGKVTGNIQQFEEILKNASGDLRFENASFYYPNADRTIDFDSLSIAVNNSDITVNRFEIQVEDHETFALTSEIKNFPGFLLEELEENGSISVHFDAPFIDVDKWMNTIGEMDTRPKENDTTRKADLASVFKDIYEFHPEFTLAVDSLKIRDLVTENVHTRVYFENDSILRLDDLHLYYGDSQAQINGALTAQNLDTQVEDSPFFFDFSVKMDGKNRDLNDFLQTVNFVFLSGDFKFDASYQGKAEDLKILNSNIEGDLRLGRSIVDIQGADLQIPVDTLHLEIKDDLAVLDQLNVNLPGKSTLDITGSIDNFTSFINNEEQTNSHRSQFTIRAPYLSKADIDELLKTREAAQDSTNRKPFTASSLKSILSNIYRSYYPSVNVNIDSLKFNNFEVSEFGSAIGYTENGDFKVEETKWNYFDGTINLDVKAGIENAEGLPVDILMQAEAIDLSELVKDLDYFHDEDLRNTEKLEGIANLVLDATAILKENGGLDMESLNGTLKIDLQHLKLFNYQPLMENTALMKDERFRNLQFRPIQQTFTVKNGMIIIPRTQIQSSAIHLFAEGRLKLGEYINIWLSLPWKNLKSSDGEVLPEKVSFEDAGWKFYIQLIQDKEDPDPKNQELKSKFRLWNSKMEKSYTREN